ncbi:MAG: SRPBCC family protein [Anaerolineae bacterium]
MTIKVKFAVEVDRPIEPVFALATDLSSLPRWSNVREVRRISTPTLQVGTTFQLVSHLGGEDRLVDCKVITLTAPRKFVYTSDGVAKSEIAFELKPLGTRTQLTYAVSIAVSALFEPLVKGEVDKQAKQDLNRLVKLLTGAT